MDARAYQVHCGFLPKQKYSLFAPSQQSHILLWKKNVQGCHQQKWGLCLGLLFFLLCLFSIIFFLL